MTSDRRQCAEDAQYDSLQLVQRHGAAEQRGEPMPAESGCRFLAREGDHRHACRQIRHDRIVRIQQNQSGRTTAFRRDDLQPEIRKKQTQPTSQTLVMADKAYGRTRRDAISFRLCHPTVPRARRPAG